MPISETRRSVSARIGRRRDDARMHCQRGFAISLHERHGVQNLEQKLSLRFVQGTGHRHQFFRHHHFANLATHWIIRAVRAAHHYKNLPAGPRIPFTHLRIGKPLRPPPLRQMIGIGADLEHQFARRGKFAGDDEFPAPRQSVCSFLVLAAIAFSPCLVKP